MQNRIQKTSVWLKVLLSIKQYFSMHLASRGAHDYDALMAELLTEWGD